MPQAAAAAAIAAVDMAGTPEAVDLQGRDHLLPSFTDLLWAEEVVSSHRLCELGQRSHVREIPGCTE